jgi:predicted restriction endonuclease
MKILGTNYKILENFDTSITVPDCIVVNKNKLGTGNGEAKLYISSKETMRSFYGKEGFNAKCFLLKEDLKQYMQATKSEYYKPTLQYRGSEEFRDLWRERMKMIDKLDDIIYFNVQDQTQIGGQRGYVKSYDDGYELIREISLPLISYIAILKLSDGGRTPIFYWKLFVDFDALDPNNALVFKYGQKKIEEDAQNTTPRQETRRETEIRYARVGQGKYREQLLEECPFCPITMINDERLLIASHIKPWAASTDNEKIDPKNGYMLSPMYDKLFDKGLITFTDDKKLVVSNWLTPKNIERIGLIDNKYYQFLPNDGDRLKYLEYHRTCVFKG